MQQRIIARRSPLIKEDRAPVFIVKLPAIHNPALAFKFHVCDQVPSWMYVETDFLGIAYLMYQKPVKY